MVRDFDDAPVDSNWKYQRSDQMEFATHLFEITYSFSELAKIFFLALRISFISLSLCLLFRYHPSFIIISFKFRMRDDLILPPDRH